MAEPLSALLDPDCVALQVKEANAEDVIRLLAEKLEAKDHVRSSFADAVIRREAAHPTGLSLGLAENIALPHADAVHVKSSAIAVATLAEPVDFRDMNGGGAVPVGLVVLAAIAEKDDQAAVSGQVTAVAKDRTLFERLLNANNPDEIAAALDRRPPPVDVEDEDDE